MLSQLDIEEALAKCFPGMAETVLSPEDATARAKETSFSMV